MGGRSLMIWPGIGYKGKTDLVFIQGKMNNQRYLQLIREQINKCAQHIIKNGFISQHDNAAIRRAKVIQTYFEQENISLLP